MKQAKQLMNTLAIRGGALSSWQPIAGWRGSFRQSLSALPERHKRVSASGRPSGGHLLQQMGLKRAKRRWRKQEVKEGDHN